MAYLRNLALLSLGIAFCIGCGDSATQSWETGKPQASGGKKTPKADEAVSNDEEPAGTESGNPHGMVDPHGGMAMPTGATAETLENDGKLDIETIHFTVPKAWIPKPHSQMLLAEFAIPKAEGDQQDGRLTVSQAGGTLEDNINRWKGQFSKKLDKEEEKPIDVGGVKVTLVDFSGTFDDSRGMMGPTVTRPDYRLLGAIFENDGRLNFIKCYGPAKTIAARADEIKEFIHSLKIDK
jgi:hypothetical protein